MAEMGIISRILYMAEEQQSQYLKFFARLELLKKLEILKLQRENFYALKQINKEIEVSILTYCSLILAIENHHKNLSVLDKNIITQKVKKLSKNHKKQKLLGYWAVIKELKDAKKQSFRQIAEYLKKYHKFGVAHSTVYELWNELEVKKISENGEK